MAITRCYLIGGAPLTGKSKWAEAIAAAHPGAMTISTDNICSEMLRTTRPEDYPNLFYDRGHDAESFYAKYDTSDKAVRAGVLQGRDIENAIRDLIARHASSSNVLIIEGVAVSPEFARSLEGEFADVPFETIILYDDYADRISWRIFTRGLWDSAETYPDHIKEKELAYVLAYNEWYRQEAARFGYRVVKVGGLVGGGL